MNLPMPRRILVVDDDAGIRNALCGYLRRQGCAVEAAANGAEGLDWVARESFDAIVSDIQMPSVDGTTFWRRAVTLHPHLRHRFVFCSAMPLPDSLASDSSIRFLAKPFELAEVWATLADLLDGPRPSRD